MHCSLLLFYFEVEMKVAGAFILGSIEIARSQSWIEKSTHITL